MFLRKGIPIGLYSSYKNSYRTFFPVGIPIRYVSTCGNSYRTCFFLSALYRNSLSQGSKTVFSEATCKLALVCSFWVSVVRLVPVNW